MSPDTRAHYCRYANEVSTIELEITMGSCDASNILGSMLQNTVHLLSSNEFLAFFNFSRASNETPEQTEL
jgi:hypothetical protein